MSDPRYDPAWVDAQYNAGAAVADAADWLRRYAEQAGHARSTLRCERDVVYGPTGAERLDVFPAAAPNAPVFVFLHGGYWRALSKDDFSGVALGPHARGITTVVVDYALCPRVTIDEIARQCRTAVAWTVRHIAAHGGDPSRVAVGGHSAGGHLSAMCLQTAWRDDWGLATDPLAAALLISGVYDIAPLRASYLQPQIRLDEGIVERCSPVRHVRACATPVLLTWGAEESGEFARQSRDFDAAWRAAGNASELLPQPGAHHFSAIEGLTRPDSALSDWLASRLGAS